MNNSTLQRILALEEQLTKATGMLKSIETLVPTMLKLEQDTSSLRESINRISEAVANVNKAMVNRTNSLNSNLGMLSGNLKVLEDTVSFYSQSLGALVVELVDSEVISPDAIRQRVQDSEDASVKDAVEQSIKIGALKEADQVGEDTLVVVSQVFVKSDGTEQKVSGYKAFESAGEALSKETKEAFLGKKVGETIEFTEEGGVLKSTVLAVYNHVEVKKDGESQQQPTAQA